MSVEQLEARLKTLENEVRILNDIEAIQRLQKAYGFYIEHVMYDELADCFADGPGVEMHWHGQGVFFGKEHVRKAFATIPGVGNRELLHLALQLCPIISVDPDGKTAKGRWYAYGGGALICGGGIMHGMGFIIYENDYVKQNGIWKIKIMRVAMIACPKPGAKPGESWVSSKRMADYDPAKDDHQSKYEFDKLDTIPCLYPSGYIYPFHYKHPVTGKEVNVEAHNATIPHVKPWSEYD